MTSIVLLALLAGLPSESSLLGELERLDRAVLTAEERVRALDSERQKLERTLAGIEADHASSELRRKDAHERYVRRLRALARMPAGARVILLGGVDSFGDYLATQRVLRWLTRHDQKLHQSYVDETTRLAKAAELLTSERRQLEELTAQTRAERDRVAERRRERLELLREALADKERTARERTRAGRELVGMIGRMRPSGPENQTFASNRGRLPWPAAGALGLGFGQQTDSASGTSITHSGIDILAQAGSTVQAVAAGRVVFAGWLPGFGQVVILDHGAEFHSVSAHLQTIAVTVGDVLPAGAALGRVGDTGSLDGTKLYFEIRHKGIAEDPQKWLRR